MPAKEPLASDDLHLLVRLYLSVAYESDRNFAPAEHREILRRLRRWMPDLDAESADAIVDTAFKAIRGGANADLEGLARALGAVLSPRLRRIVLADLGRVARADGFLSVQEASIIRRVRAALNEGDTPTDEKQKDASEDRAGTRRSR